MVRLEYSVGNGWGGFETDPEVRQREYSEAQEVVLEEIARNEAAGIDRSAHLPNYNGSDAPDD